MSGEGAGIKEHDEFFLCDALPLFINAYIYASFFTLIISPFHNSLPLFSLYVFTIKRLPNAMEEI